MLKPKKIFLADDDHDDIEFFQDALNELEVPYELTVSYHGSQLLQQLNDCGDNLPDLIFIDVNMPLMNGLEALAKLRSQERYATVPVIIHSTTSNRFYIKEAHRNRAQYYFIKPSAFMPLKAKLQYIIGIDWQNYRQPEGAEEFVLQSEK